MATNTPLELSNQIELLQQQNQTLSNHVVSLSNYIENSISHSQYIERLDWIIMVTGILLAIFAIIATVVVGLSISKIFSSAKEEASLLDRLETSLKTNIHDEFSNIADQIQTIITKIEEKQYIVHNEDDNNLFDHHNDDDIPF